MKFGGTSMGDADCIQRSARIVADAASDISVVVVVSAMSGVTNRLVDAASKSVSGDEGPSRLLAQSLRNEHFAVADALVSDDSQRQQLKLELEKITAEVSN